MILPISAELVFLFTAEASPSPEHFRNAFASLPLRGNYLGEDRLRSFVYNIHPPQKQPIL